MKTLFVLFAICAVAVLAHTDEEKRAAVDACITQTGANRDTVNKALVKGEWESGNTKLNCFSVCYLKKLGLVDNLGNWKKDELDAYVSSLFAADKVSQVKAACDPGFDASCYSAYLLSKCWSEQRANA